MAYRIEISATNRAACKAGRCKDGIKIQKGELRHGVLVTIQDKQSWSWRHWGCVTPAVMRNWWENAEENLELIDGYDELPQQAQEKVAAALKQGHVDDQDWNGDEGFNRYNPAAPRQGMYAKTPRKKQGDEDANGGEDSPTKKPGQKRAREQDDEADKPAKKTKAKKAAADDDEDAEEKPVKKTKAKAKKSAADEEDEVAPPKKTKKSKAKPTEDEDDDADKPAPKKRQAKSKVKATEPDEQSAEDAEPEPTKKSRAKKSKATEADNEAEEAKPKRTRKAKA